MKKAGNLFMSLFIISVILLVHGCKKGDPPEVTTVEVSEITANTAISGGNIISDGGCDITEKGVCWNTGGNPTITDSKTNNGKGSGSFISNLSGLEPATSYYVRAYATNGAGTAYGEEIVFNTKVADADGNLYNAVKIGTQVWMAENLKTTKFSDDNPIPLVSDNTSWSVLTTPGYCWYNNDEDYSKNLYGALYNWHAVNSGKLCPAGWHAATEADFNVIELYLGLTQEQIDTWGWRGIDQGSRLKNTTGWNTGETGTNTSGFSALPGGYRYYADGTFNGINTLGYWWTASQHDDDRAWYRRLDGNNTGIYKASTNKEAGKSVRCVKD